MATCHGLAYSDGKLVGDPIDIIMFKSTEWVLEEGQVQQQGLEKHEPILAKVYPPADKQLHKRNHEICIVKRFDFTSREQRMSVLTRKGEQNQYKLYIKGAPEKIRALSLKTTLPADFNELLDIYSQKGFRILAFGMRTFNLPFEDLD